MATKKDIAVTNNAELVVNNDFINNLSEQLKQKEEFGMKFPSDYNYQNALMGAYLVLKEKGKDGKTMLESCSQISIANALMEMCTKGLNVQRKQGYLIGYGGKCQFQPSYFGNITVARRFGLKTVDADVIYEGDTFRYHKENARTVIDEHSQDFMNIDNEKIIGAYAVATMEDGSVIAEIMNINQLKKAWSQKQGGYKEVEYDTHVKFREEMSKKTVTNRLIKNITNTYGDITDIVAEELPSKSEIDTKNVAYEIETQANTVDFVEDNDEVVIEHVDGEVEPAAFLTE